MPHDPPELLERFARGDEEALETLLELHLPALRGYVRLRTGRELRARESASDVVQSICREILEKREKFKFPGPDGFRRWLYATALRKIQMHARYWRTEKRGAAVERPLDTATPDAELLAGYASVCTPSAELAAREEVLHIEHAFDRLPEDYRTVIALSRLAQLSHADVAAEMERTEGSVKMLLSRALARLTELLAQTESGA